MTGRTTEQSFGAEAATDAIVRKLRKELNSGTVSLVLLSFLAQAGRAMYGYQIAKGLESRSNDGSAIKHGTLYPVLRSLEAQSLLVSEVEPSVSGPPRRYYTITEQGRATLRLWTEVWAQTRGFVDRILQGVGDE